MELGYGVITQAQGKGLVEEAMRAMLAWGDEYGAGELYTCVIHEDHAASIRVANKLGLSEFARAAYNGNPMALLERVRPARHAAS
jgi:RimJ/RimL family protein N-acetyltransferase